jgi:hypothetical protein
LDLILSFLATFPPFSDRVSLDDLLPLGKSVDKVGGGDCSLVRVGGHIDPMCGVPRHVVCVYLGHGDSLGRENVENVGTKYVNQWVPNSLLPCWGEMQLPSSRVLTASLLAPFSLLYALFMALRSSFLLHTTESEKKREKER